MSKYWKTVVTVTVLSKGDDPPSFDSLEDLHGLIADGPCSGDYGAESQEIDRDTAQRLLEEQRSDPYFLDPGAEWRADVDGDDEDTEDTEDTGAEGL